MVKNSTVKSANLKQRPPVVAILGHTDHGKTTLLDYIRKTKIVEKESGGITQSVGAYEIEIRPKDEPKIRDDFSAGGRKITFIDTPGHEAFSKMRTYGARAADIAILVIAADDGVKPQTESSLEQIKKSDIPFLVVVNKIDKPNADINKVKNDLARLGVFLEGQGGSISWQTISAKTGEGVTELLELLILAADVQNLTFDPSKTGSGFIISSYKNSRSGFRVGIIAQDGILKTGDFVTTETANGKIKSIENFLGERVSELVPSSPAVILGFEKLPSVGEIFFAGPDLVTLKEKFQQKELGEEGEGGDSKTNEGAQQEQESKKQIMKLLIKAHEGASLEVVEELILKIDKDFQNIKTITSSVGDINENDIKMAENAGAIIIGFKIKADSANKNLARIKNIKIINSDIIYKLEEEVRELLKTAAAGERKREIKILAVFSKKDKKQVIGGEIIFGPIKKNESFEIENEEEEIIGRGKLTNIQSQKKDIQQIEIGEEAGLLVESEVEIKKDYKLLFK